MRASLSISVPEDVKRELDAAVAEEGLTRSDVVRQALRDYLFARRFRSLRARLQAQAAAAGAFTDEDVFERVS